MNSFNIHIRKSDSIINKLRLDKSIKGSIKNEFVLNSEIHNDSKHSFGRKKEIKRLLKYLEKYRLDPENCNFDEEISNQLLNFFYSDIEHKNKFYELINIKSSINLHFRLSDKFLLTNIPWELSKLEQNGKSRSNKYIFDKTLSSLPLSRVLECKSNLKINKKERLKILTCISDPDPEFPLHSESFYSDIKSILDKNKWLIDYKNCFGKYTNDQNKKEFNFKPNFDDLLVDIDFFKPNILILAAHGTSKSQSPSVYFYDSKSSQNRWFNIEDIAIRLNQVNSCLCVIIVACDLSHSSTEDPSSSGAITFLNHGVPSVIAMQSSILVKAGYNFLDSLLRHFTNNLGNKINRSLSSSVSFGRYSIAKSLSDDSIELDWSFPALFYCKDGIKILDGISEYFDNFISWITSLRTFSFKLTHKYYERKGYETEIKEALQSLNSGLIEIIGEVGVGKSEIIKKVCLDIYDDLENSSFSYKPPIYFDFSEENNQFDDYNDLVYAINRKIKETSPYQSTDKNSASGLFKSINPTDPNNDYSKEIIKWIDVDARIFVFDNLSKRQIENLKGIFEKAGFLKKSTIVLLTSDNCNFKESQEIKIKSLSLEEIEKFIAFKNLDNGDKVQNKEISQKIYETFGGSINIINLLSADEILEGNIFKYKKYSSLLKYKCDYIIDKLKFISNDTYNSYLKITNYPKGISEDQVDLIDINRSTFRKLIDSDFLLRVDKKSFNQLELSYPSYKIPYYIRELIRDNNTDDLEDATFDQIESIEEKLGLMHDDTSLLEKKIKKYFLTDANETFLIDTIDSSISLGEEFDSFSVLIMSMLDTPFYEKDKLEILYQLWNRSLKYCSKKTQKPTFWLKLGKVAHLLGRLEKTKYCINKIKSFKLEISEDIIDYNILNANYLKDLGAFEKYDLIMDMYHEAEVKADQLIEASHEKDLINSIVKKALVHYNRSIILRWWKKDIENALADINKTIELTENKYDWLYYLSLSEKVDMITKIENSLKNLNELKNDLYKCIDYYSERNNFEKLSRAFYRLSKVESQSYSIEEDNDHKKIIILKVLQNYEKARDFALEGNIEQLYAIAQAHILSTIILIKKHKISSNLIEKYTDDILLNLFNDTINDLELLETSWSKRVLRDLLWNKIEFLKINGSNDFIGLYEKALEISISKPLHPKKGKDMERTANLLHSYLDYLYSNEQYNDCDKLILKHKSLLEIWFNIEIEKIDISKLIKMLLTIAKKPDNYG